MSNLPSLHFFSIAQISNFAHLVMNKNICQLKVAMHHTDIMKPPKPIDQLFKVEDSRVFAEWHLPFKIMLHISAITQLSHNQDTGASLKYIVAFYDVLVIALSQYLDLIFYQLIQFWVRHQILLWNSLYCKLNFFFFIIGFIHPC